MHKAMNNRPVPESHRCPPVETQTEHRHRIRSTFTHVEKQEKEAKDFHLVAIGEDCGSFKIRNPTQKLNVCWEAKDNKTPIYNPITKVNSDSHIDNSKLLWF